MKPGVRNLLIAVVAVAVFAAAFGVTALARSGGGADDTKAIEKLEDARGLCAAVGADASGLDVNTLFSKSKDGRTLSTETSGEVSLKTARVLLSCAVGRVGGPDDLSERIKTEPTGSAKFGAYSTTWELTGGRFEGSVTID